jgi:hypothetical protein
VFGPSPGPACPASDGCGPHPSVPEELEGVPLRQYSKIEYGGFSKPSKRPSPLQSIEWAAENLLRGPRQDRGPMLCPKAAAAHSNAPAKARSFVAKCQNGLQSPKLCSLMPKWPQGSGAKLCSQDGQTARELIQRSYSGNAANRR